MIRTLHDGSYTVYIGGIYEEDHAAGGTVAGVRKYYQMNGRTVAVRNAADASGTQTGTLDFLLLDHLGSVVGLLGTSGNVEPGTATTYWPYGAVRTGGLDSSAESDRQFTGQRIETGDAALGLYNYNARFYSTTLGAFVSADTSAKDGVNRFAYVLGNPLNAIDPTGLDVLVVCGFTDNCAHGTASGAFRNAVEEYWARTARTFGPYSLDQAFALLQYVAIVGHWDTDRTLSAFGAGFVNTALDSSELNSHRENAHINLQDYVDRVTDAVAHDSAVDFLVGFSMGGATIADWMNQQRGPAGAYVYPSLLSQIKSVLLIEPAFDVAGYGFFGNPHLDARDFSGIRIVTQNGDSDASVGGFVANSPLNYIDRECDTGPIAHCEHKGTQSLDVDIALGWCVPEGPAPAGVQCQDGTYHAQ